MNSADQAVLEKLDLKKGDRWLYLFDFGDEWKFDVTVKDIEEGRSNRKAQVLEGKDVPERTMYSANLIRRATTKCREPQP